LVDRLGAKRFSKHARIVGADRSKLAERLKREYEKGASIRDLIKETGRSYGFVHRLLVEEGVDLRARGGIPLGAATRQAIRRERKVPVVKRQRKVPLFAPANVGTDGIVYYMRIGNRVKIGWTGNLKSRMKSINPEELLATEPGTRDKERQRHKQFEHLRVHGEWFAMEESLLSHIDILRSSPQEEVA
jgi:hypothetical protein